MFLYSLILGLLTPTVNSYITTGNDTWIQANYDCLVKNGSLISDILEGGDLNHLWTHEYQTFSGWMQLREIGCYIQLNSTPSSQRYHNVKLGTCQVRCTSTNFNFFAFKDNYCYCLKEKHDLSLHAECNSGNSYRKVYVYQTVSMNGIRNSQEHKRCIILRCNGTNETYIAEDCSKRHKGLCSNGYISPHTETRNVSNQICRNSSTVLALKKNTVGSNPNGCSNTVHDTYWTGVFRAKIALQYNNLKKEKPVLRCQYVNVRKKTVRYRWTSECNQTRHTFYCKTVTENTTTAISRITDEITSRNTKHKVTENTTTAMSRITDEITSRNTKHSQIDQTSNTVFKTGPHSEQTSTNGGDEKHDLLTTKEGNDFYLLNTEEANTRIVSTPLQTTQKSTMSVTPNEQKDTGPRNIAIIVGVAVAVFVGIVLLSSVVLYVIYQRKVNTKAHQDEDTPMYMDMFTNNTRQNKKLSKPSATEMGNGEQKNNQVLSLSNTGTKNAELKTKTTYNKNDNDLEVVKEGKDVHFVEYNHPNDALFNGSCAYDNKTFSDSNYDYGKRTEVHQAVIESAEYSQPTDSVYSYEVPDENPDYGNKFFSSRNMDSGGYEGDGDDDIYAEENENQYDFLNKKRNKRNDKFQSQDLYDHTRPNCVGNNEGCEYDTATQFGRDGYNEYYSHTSESRNHYAGLNQIDNRNVEGLDLDGIYDHTRYH